MERVENNEYKERPFERLKVYFSNSIKGEIGKVEDIGVSVVTFLIEKGADVLSENVAFLKPEIGLPIFQRRTGIDLTKVTDDMERARIIRKADINWVDNATHLIAIVNGASYGVGIELQRAMDKPKMGMNRTPVLCLAHKDSFSGLSNMIKGIDPVAEGIPFELTAYEDLEDAKIKITDFLMKNK